MQTYNKVQQLQDGRQLVLEEIIGRGGYGQVWIGSLTESETKRNVAVKCVEVLTEDDERRARTEIYALHKFTRSWYSAVPGLIAYEISNFQLKIVMELFDGTLAKHLKDITSPGLIHIGEVAFHSAEVIRQISMAVNAVHAKGIVHKDLKPDNILVRIVEGKPYIKVTDFGLSKIVGQEDSFQASGSGTHTYNAPETILLYGTCELTSKVDVFAAGIVYYQIIFGVQSHPFGSVDNAELILIKIRNGDRLFDDRCVKGSEVYHLLDKMLSMTPGERPSMQIVDQHPCNMTDDAKMRFLSHMLDLKADKHMLTAIENWMHRDWTELSAYSTMRLAQKNWLTTFFTEEEIHLFGIRETTSDNAMMGIKEVLQQVVKTAKNREKDVFNWLQRGWLSRPSLFLFIWLESTSSRNVKQTGYSFHTERIKLQKLAEINDSTNMRKLLETMTSEEVNWQSPTDGKTALHLAVSSASDEVVEYLCEYGARWDIQDGAGWTPLHYAARRSKRFLDIFFDGRNKIAVVHNTGWTPLHVASASVLYENVELLLDEGAHVNVRDEKGDTPLHIAVQTAPRRKGELLDYPEESVLPDSRFGSERAVNPACPIDENNVPFKIAELLIHRGAEVNGKNSRGETPLHLASRDNYHEIAKLLHEQGAVLNEKDNSGQTPLHRAAFRNAQEVVRLLIEWRSEINVRDMSSESPLRLAVKRSFDELVGQLLNSGADINETTEAGQTLLHTATWERLFEVADILLKRGAQVNRKDVFGQTPLHLAMEKNDPALAELLLEYGADLNITGLYEQTPLHWAMENRHLDIVEFLLGRGMDVNQKDADGGTAFHLAVEKGYYDTVLLFLGHGAVVNQKCCYGETPLHRAASFGHFEITQLLVQHNADVNAKCDNDRAPLQHAVLNKHYEIAKLLLENSAKVNEANSFQQTSLHLVRGSSNSFLLTKLLLDYGALIDVRDWKDQTPLNMALMNDDLESARLLLERGAAIQDTYIQGETPLCIAAKNSNPQMVQLLLAWGATVNGAGKHGQTPLHFAVQETDFQTAEILIKNGAAVNQTNKYGETALHFASTRNLEMVKLLLHVGALVNEKDNYGRTALSLALSKDFSDISQLLRDHGATEDEVNHSDDDWPSSLINDCDDK